MKPTKDQLKLINDIRKVLGIVFIGRTLQDASNFIDKFKNIYSIKKYGKPWKDKSVVLNQIIFDGEK